MSFFIVCRCFINILFNSSLLILNTTVCYRTLPEYKTQYSSKKFDATRSHLKPTKSYLKPKFILNLFLTLKLCYFLDFVKVLQESVALSGHSVYFNNFNLSVFLLFFALPSLKKIRRNKFSSTFDLFNFCLASTIYNVYISMFFVLQAHFPCEEKCLGEFIKQFTIMPVPFHFLDFRVLFLFDFQHHQHLFLPLVSQFYCVVVFGGRHSGSPTG